MKSGWSYLSNHSTGELILSRFTFTIKFIIIFIGRVDLTGSGLINAKKSRGGFTTVPIFQESLQKHITECAFFIRIP
jgi:hypothetical protein